MRRAASAVATVVALHLAARIAALQGDPLTDEILKIMQDGADAGAGDPGVAQLSLKFDATNPAAVEAARTRGATLVAEVTSATRQEIATLVADALTAETAAAPAELARDLRDLVGLNGQQQLAVENLAEEMRAARPGATITRRPPRSGVRRVPGFRARVPTGGPTSAWVRRNTARYAQQQLNLRAVTIARSETIRAANAGQRELWRQAVASGQLPTDTRRTWITAGDDRVRQEHADIDGEVVGINESFSLGVEPGEPVNCRCGQAIAPREGVGVGR